MQKAIKYSKIIAWIGIILNAILLLVVFILHNAYFDASWFLPVLHILSPIGIIGEIMMYGGIIVKAILEYKSGVRMTRRDFIFVLTAIIIVVVYYLLKFLFQKA